MRASDLRPGQFFESPYDKRRRLVVDRHDEDQQIEVFHKQFGLVHRYHYNNEVLQCPQCWGEGEDVPDEVRELKANLHLAQRAAERRGEKIKELESEIKQLKRDFVTCCKINGVGQAVIDCYDLPELWDNPPTPPAPAEQVEYDDQQSKGV